MSMQSAASPPLVGFTELLSAALSSTDILIGGGLFGFDISSMSGVLGTEAYQNYFGHRKSISQLPYILSLAARQAKPLQPRAIAKEASPALCLLVLLSVL